MRYEEVLVPVGIGLWGESLIYEERRKLEDGAILHEQNGVWMEEVK